MQILSTISKPALIGLFSAISLWAYPQDFEVAPVLVSFDANPGEVQTQVLTVRNHSNERQKFVLNLVDYTVNDEGAKIAQETGSSARSLVDWITINPSMLELNPNQSAEASLIMTVPRTGFNTRWGMIQVEVAREQVAQQADKQLATGVVIVPRFVVLVKQSPRSNQNYKGMVTDLREVEKTKSGLRSFEAILTNTGDKILDAKVFLALANLETAEEQQFRPMPVTVYPDHQRRVILSLPEQPEPGQYALAFMMDYGHRAPIEGAQILLTVE